MSTCRVQTDSTYTSLKCSSLLYDKIPGYFGLALNKKALLFCFYNLCFKGESKESTWFAQALREFLKDVSGPARVIIYARWMDSGPVFSWLSSENTSLAPLPCNRQNVPWRCGIISLFELAMPIKFGFHQHIGESYTNWICLIHM